MDVAFGFACEVRVVMWLGLGGVAVASWVGCVSFLDDVDCF